MNPPNFVDLTGQTFGSWKVLSRAVNTPVGSAQYKCRCSCGKVRVRRASELRHGWVKSCGCSKKKNRRPPADLAGQTFGRLTALRHARGKKNRLSWECQCACGNLCVVATGHLRSGHSQSCGCRSQELSAERSRTHGGSRTPEFRTWCHAKARCSSPEDKSYPDYGGRGIAMCDRWKDSFPAFLEDMGRRPPGTSLERINNDGNYEPGNCRWATPKEQSNNRRSRRH